MKIKSFARVARHLVCVKNEDNIVLCICAVIAHYLHQPFSRRSEVGVGKTFEILPRKYHIISVNQHIAFPIGQLKIRVFVFVLFRRGTVKLILWLAELTLHNRLKLLVVNMQISAVDGRSVGLFFF